MNLLLSLLFLTIVAWNLISFFKQRLIIRVKKLIRQNQ